MKVVPAANDKEACLHPTKPPNALPASEHCPGQPGAGWEVFHSACTVRSRSWRRASRLCQAERGQSRGLSCFLLTAIHDGAGWAFLQHVLFLFHLMSRTNAAGKSRRSLLPAHPKVGGIIQSLLTGVSPKSKMSEFCVREQQKAGYSVAFQRAAAHRAALRDLGNRPSRRRPRLFPPFPSVKGSVLDIDIFRAGFFYKRQMKNELRQANQHA